MMMMMMMIQTSRAVRRLHYLTRHDLEAINNNRPHLGTPSKDVSQYSSASRQGVQFIITLSLTTARNVIPKMSDADKK